MTDPTSSAFQGLDFLYIPSRDVAADTRHFTNELGGRVVFAVQAMGTRVAAIELAPGSPLVVLTDHLDGERPILIYRVDDLAVTLGEMERRGWDRESTLDIPHGPCCSFRTPGGHRIAVYQLTRPHAAARFAGRRDF